MGLRGREAIKPGSEVTIELKPRLSGNSNSEEAVRVALLSLVIGSHFQGLGARSRKGFGAFKVSGEDVPTLEKALNELAMMLNLAPVKPTYTVKQLSHKLPESWQQVLNKLGYFYRSFRERGGKEVQRGRRRIKHTLDYDEVIIPIKNKEEPRRKPSALAPAFGLPVNYRNSKKESFSLTPYKEHNRRASPIFMTFSESEIWLSLWGDEYLPPKEKVGLKMKGRGWVGEPFRYDMELTKHFYENFVRELRM